MLFKYFDANHGIEVHDAIIEKSGGLSGIINLGLLDSTLSHVKNDSYYPEIEDKVTHLFYSINKNHCFNDGNKRTAIALSAYLLEINGLDSKIDLFIKRMENITVYVAENRIDKELLKELISSTIYEYEYNEELKLQLFNALSS
jgi:death-on-curing protein